ncbi:alpha/beta hydrolase family protein [Gordonia jinhuaensis]|uniref:Esterase n=1 Tax=Gordonia jinhuaensis TaxID=1517702 RepID=A0A916T4E0_9ACTN|nr:alpha/beta hydrolase family protein [Gordonia jinhuaensis]GGB30025.1 esterase [Gordonia jinhuaensis]
MTVAVLAATLVATTGALVTPAAANAAPVSAGATAPDGSKLTSAVQNGQSASLTVHSAAMNRDIPLDVLLPHDRSKPRPTLYLLNGAGGGEDAATWLKQSDAATFFANKNVNVVIPEAGAFTYYTDWIRDDPELGRNKWETFLTAELPPIINSALGANGTNAIAGISSSATSVLNMVIHHRDLYRAVGSYSGCAASSSPQGHFYIQAVVSGRGGGDTDNMWGKFPGPLWTRNDAVVNAEGLRGKAIYISNATGLPGKYDNPSYVPDPVRLGDQLVIGGIIEAATRQCTQMLVDKLQSLHIPAHYNFPAGGTHSWNYWQDQLHWSWPVLGKAIGA